MNTLSEILSSRTRAEIFRLLYGPAEEELHIREIERRTGLNEREIDALRLMVIENKIFAKEIYQNIFIVSRRTALRDLKGPVESKQIILEGVGKGT